MTAVIGAEIPGAGVFLWFLPQGGAKAEIAAEGFQDMLPGPDGTGITNADRLLSAEEADAIGNEAVRTQVAPADDVARPGGGSADLRILREE